MVSFIIWFWFLFEFCRCFCFGCCCCWAKLLNRSTIKFQLNVQPNVLRMMTAKSRRKRNDRETLSEHNTLSSTYSRTHMSTKRTKKHCLCQLLNIWRKSVLDPIIDIPQYNIVVVVVVFFFIGTRVCESRY